MVSFNYIPSPKKNEKGEIVGEIYRPMVTVRLCYKHKISPFPVNCILDSGSDRNLFPGWFAKNIGINLKKGKKKIIRGIGAMGITAYEHEVDIYVEDKKFKTTIDFSDDQQVGLLGRSGFFNLFQKIIFKEKNKIIELH